MRKSLGALLLLVAFAGASPACECRPPGGNEAAEWRMHWDDARAVVIAEIVGESSEPATAWFSRNHVVGFSSPLRRRPLLQLIVRHRWKGDLADGSTFVVEKVDGATCGYEGWPKGRYHLLYLRKSKHWLAVLCGLSHSVVEVASAVKEQDAEIARFLGKPATH